MLLRHGSMIAPVIQHVRADDSWPRTGVQFWEVSFPLIIFSAGFAGNVMSFIFSPNPSLGSSTAIFGLLAAEAVFVFQNRKFFGGQARKILINSATLPVSTWFWGCLPASITGGILAVYWAVSSSPGLVVPLGIKRADAEPGN